MGIHAWVLSCDNCGGAYSSPDVKERRKTYHWTLGMLAIDRELGYSAHIREVQELCLNLRYSHGFRKERGTMWEARKHLIIFRLSLVEHSTTKHSSICTLFL